MTKIVSPLFSRASGLVGNIELYNCNGQNIARARKLRRYKQASAAVLYRQLLLKKIVLGFSGCHYLFKSFSPASSRLLNYHNYFVGKNYDLFYLNEYNYLFCSDVSAIRFFKQSAVMPFSASEPYYSDQNLYIDINPSFTDVDFSFVAVVALVQFDKTDVVDLNPSIAPGSAFVIYEPYRLFNSQGFHTWIIRKNLNSGKFDAFIYAGYFAH